MSEALDPYQYDLPADKIAQRPVYPYDQAKLLLVDKGASSLNESVFTDIADFLQSSDLLVFNDTAVKPARLFGRFADSGGQVEVLLVNELADNSWQCLARPLKKFHAGRQIKFSEELSATIGEREDNLINLSFNSAEHLASVGTMPIPPYIRGGHSDEQDKLDYQTHFAKTAAGDDGGNSIAAPTASLHFTPELMSKIKDKGVQTINLTLHVGLASFLPLWNDSVEDLSPPGREEFKVAEDTWATISQHRSSGGRVIAVGTTVVRALESQARNLQGETDLFITPGFQFKIVDALVTNFHQPATTHLLLVEAFIGKDLLASSYDYALNNNFRFLSYGDGMLLA